MTVSEYEARFHELSRNATMILPTEGERVRCFVRGLRYRLRVDTEHMVSAGRSFLDVVDHARSMEHIHREAQGGSDKRARYQRSYSESQTRGRDLYDRPRQRFQQGQTSRPIQATLPVSEGGQYQQSGPSTGQNSGDQILFLHAAVVLLQGVQLRGVMIVVLLTIGLENAPGEVGGDCTSSTYF